MDGKDLATLRTEIDGIDERILELLGQRAAVAESVAAVKRAAGATTFHDPERERQVLDRLMTKGAGRFPREAIRAVFREVMSGCLALEEPMTVAFLGPEGTYTHMASRELFGLGARYREATTIDGVFDAVRRKEATYGVVPIENSTEGPVTWTLDSLTQGDISIRQELVLEIEHCLLSRAAGLTTIERVYSHPQGLAQCRVWLAKYLPQAQVVHTPSTAGASREALADDRAAAIASRLAAELFGLPILRENIQDKVENATRFVVLSQKDAPRTGDDKTSVAFSLPDAGERGSLRRVLEIFDAASINLSRIESRPKGQRIEGWEYLFFVDLVGHRSDEPVAAALRALDGRCDMVKVLGSYPRYRGRVPAPR